MTLGSFGTNQGFGWCYQTWRCAHESTLICCQCLDRFWTGIGRWKMEEGIRERDHVRIGSNASFILTLTFFGSHQNMTACTAPDHNCIKCINCITPQSISTFIQEMLAWHMVDAVLVHGYMEVHSSLPLPLPLHCTWGYIHLSLSFSLGTLHRRTTPTLSPIATQPNTSHHEHHRENAR